MTARCLVLASILLVIGLPAPAAAEPDELKALEDEIARDETALSTEGCAVACQAFSSMQRAADRLCALDPGARCAAARAKVKAAAGRVRASCPECGIGSGEPSPIAEAQGGSEHKADAPPNASPPPKGGGCAGCNVGDGERGGAGALASALAWALARWRRRRKSAPSVSARF